MVRDVFSLLRIVGSYIMFHVVVVTPNACHVRAHNLVHRYGVQVSKKQNVSSLFFSVFSSQWPYYWYLFRMLTPF